MIRLQREEFNVDEVLHEIRVDSIGGLVTFVGVVRNESKGRRVERMEIEVYPDMALMHLERIRNEACSKFNVEVAIIHRYGELKVGDKIMMIAVGGGHRAEAFEACRFILEEIKTKVPIWKKEITPDGEFWVEGEKHGET